ncbi:hypothetical protein ABK040_006184 [Willaertia magna]
MLNVRRNSGDSNKIPSIRIKGGETNSELRSGVSSSKNSSSTLGNNSVYYKLEDSLYSFIIALKIDKPIHYLVYFLIQVLLIWQTLSLGVLIEFNWGEYGTWFFSIFAIPRTFGFQFVPYNVFIAVAVLSFVLEVIAILAIYFTWAAQSKGSKYWSKIVLIARIVFAVLPLVSMPSIYGMSAAFLDCNYRQQVLLEGSDTPVYVLERFPTIACWSPLNGTFAGLGIAFMFLQVLLTSISGFIYSDTFINSRSWFVLDNPLLMTYMISSNQLYLIAAHITPRVVNYLRPAYYLVFSLLFIALLIYQLPFIKRQVNVFYIGLGFGRVGIGIASILATALNTNKDWGYGLGLMGGAIGGFALFFTIGIIFGEIYTRRACGIGRELCKSAVELKTTQDITDNVFRNIHLFLRFSMRGSKDDKAISGKFVKLVINQRLELSASMLVTCALLIRYALDDHSTTYAMLFLANAQKKKKDALSRFIFIMRQREMERLASTGANNFALERILEKAKKNMEHVRQLHKLFWKNLTSSHTEDEEKFYNIAKQIEETTRECQDIFNNLLVNHGNNKNVLRAYATFLEEFLFEPGVADELYTEANIIEEEESKKKGDQTIYDIFGRKKGSSKQLFTTVNTNSNGNSFKNTLNSPTREKDQTNLTEDIEFDTFKGNVNDELLESASNFADNNLSKAERQKELFRTSINKREEYTIFLIFLLSLGLISLLLLATIMGLGVGIVDNERGAVHVINKICWLSPISYMALSDVRNLQSFLHNHMLLPEDLRTTLLEHKKRFNSYLTLLSSIYTTVQNRLIPFPNQVMDGYLKPDKQYTIPVVKLINFTVSYETKNSSIAEMCTVLHNSIDSLYDTSIERLNNTYQSFDFLFLWYNRKIMALSFEQYCGLMVDETISRHNNQKIIFIAVSVTFTVLFLVYVCFYTIIFLLHVSKFRSLRRLFHLIPKEEAEKIFQNLDSKLEDKIMTIKISSDLQLYYNEVSSHLDELTTDWNYLRFGDSSNGFQSLAVSSDIEKLIYDKTNCTKDTAYSCSGLDELIKEITVQYTKFHNDAFKSDIPLGTLLYRYSTIFDLSTQTSTLLMNAMVQYVGQFTSQNYYISAVTIGVSAPLLLIIAYCIYISTIAFEKEVHQLRILLNYVNYEILDSIVELHSYIFNYSLTEKSDNNKRKTDKSSKSRAILEAAVAGAIIISKTGSIEIFNEAAQKIFGHRNDEVIGTPFTSLFSGQSRSILQSTLNTFSKSTSNTAQTLEVIGIRKNKANFPARVSLSVSVIGDGNFILACFIEDTTAEKQHELELADEKKKSEALLLNILPENIALRLKSGEIFIADKMDDVTCLFSDIIGFADLYAAMNAQEIVQTLNTIVNGFDSLIEKHNLEKIKTIQEKYFCAGGLTPGDPDHTRRMLQFAIEMFSVIYNYNADQKKELSIKVGIHVGTLVAGVIGTLKFAYDVWGDAVNTSSRMESTGIPGRIQVSRQAFERVNEFFEFEERSGVYCKGKGNLTTYLLLEKYHQSPIPTHNSSVKDITRRIRENSLLPSHSKLHDVISSHSSMSSREDHEERIIFNSEYA